MSDFKRLSEEIINSFDDVVSEICIRLSSFSKDVIVNDGSEEYIKCSSVLLDLANFINNLYANFRLNYAQAYMLLFQPKSASKIRAIFRTLYFLCKFIRSLIRS